MRNLLLALATAGCSSALTVPEAGHVDRVRSDWPGTALDDLARGRATYIQKCSGCHTLYLPPSRSGSEWREQVARMAERAHLTASQTSDITRYLVAVAP